MAKKSVKLRCQRKLQLSRSHQPLIALFNPKLLTRDITNIFDKCDINNLDRVALVLHNQPQRARASLTIDGQSEFMTTFLFFALLQLADFVSTITAISFGGVEKNPVTASFFGGGPVLGLLATKLILLVVAGGIVWIGRVRSVRLANFAYCAVVLWNVSIIARLVIAHHLI